MRERRKKLTEQRDNLESKGGSGQDSWSCGGCIFLTTSYFFVCGNMCHQPFC